MDNTDKIKKLAELRRNNPEEFNRLVKENIEKNKAFAKMMDSVPIEKAVEADKRNWLDGFLEAKGELENDEILKMTPFEKVDLFLSLENITGQTGSIIRAVSAAYGVELPI